MRDCGQKSESYFYLIPTKYAKKMSFKSVEPFRRNATTNTAIRDFYTPEIIIPCDTAASLHIFAPKHKPIFIAIVAAAAANTTIRQHCRCAAAAAATDVADIIISAQPQHISISRNGIRLLLL